MRSGGYALNGETMVHIKWKSLIIISGVYDMNKMRPIPPGEILAEEIEARSLSASALAAACGVVPNRITQILSGKRAITADTALRFGRYFGTTPEFWMNLQQSYDLKLAQQAVGKQIERDVMRGAA
jgi:addiction module HigA family antidote